MINMPHPETKDLIALFNVMDAKRQSLIMQLLGTIHADHGITKTMRHRKVIECADASGEFMIWLLSPVPLASLHQEAEQLLINGYVYADSSWMTGVDCKKCQHPGSFHIRYHLHDQNGKFLPERSRCFDVCFACLQVFESIEVEYPKSNEAITPCSEDPSQQSDRESLTVTSPAQGMTPTPDHSKVSA